MNLLDDCFAANRRWAADMVERDPEYFKRLEHCSAPTCCGSAARIAGCRRTSCSGARRVSIFVHRNVANVVEHTDVNCLSVLQYAIDVLEVKHVIVCGHYGCGGVSAAMSTQPLGLIDNWLRHIRDVHLWNREELNEIADLDARANRLAELNVEAQVANVCHTTIVQDAWRRGQSVTVHGWIYAVADGLLRDLGIVVESAEQIPPEYRLY